MPDYDAPPFLLERFLDIGAAEASGFGMVPIGWGDLDAWQRCSGVELPPWQARMFLDLSREFCGFLRKAEKPDCPAPWSEEAFTANRREEVSRQLRIGFRALILSKQS